MTKYRGYCDKCDSWTEEGSYPVCTPKDATAIPVDCRLHQPHPIKEVETFDEKRARQASQKSDSELSDFDRAWYDTFKMPYPDAAPGWLEASPVEPEFAPEPVETFTDTTAGRFSHKDGAFTPWPAVAADDSFDAAVAAFLPGCLAAEALPDFNPFSEATTAVPVLPTDEYPDNNPKTVLGLSKPSFTAIPPVALIHMGAAMSDGRRKYGQMNWREKRVTTGIYVDAIMRHLLSYWDGEDIASDSKVKHLGHVMACCAIILDAEATGNLNDDRPIPGPFADTVAALTVKA